MKCNLFAHILNVFDRNENEQNKNKEKQIKIENTCGIRVLEKYRKCPWRVTDKNQKWERNVVVLKKVFSTKTCIRREGV